MQKLNLTDMSFLCAGDTLKGNHVFISQAHKPALAPLCLKFYLTQEDNK